MPQPIAITGLGVVSPNGIGVRAFTEALRQGRSGIRKITEFDTSMLQVRSAGTVVGFDPHAHMSVPDVRRTPRMVPFAVAAAREALTMSGLTQSSARSPQSSLSLDLSRQIAVALGTGGGGLPFVENQYRRYFTNAGGYSPFTIVAGTHGNLSSELSIQLGLRGPSHVLSTGCASSTDAIGHAMLLIRAGIVPVVLAGGADAPIAEGILKGFELMRILASEREDPATMSRPFARDRDGFVLGEGAWMFVLEDLAHARRRGATVFAELLGYGSTCDAYHRVQPAPDTTECVRAIEIALADATRSDPSVSPDALDYVNLHGTSTQLNDVLETRALHAALGRRAPSVPMSATKSMIGHPQGACGAAGLAATILSLRAHFLHPTINLAAPDPACDLDYVPNAAREVPATRNGTGHIALCNCIAFGSKNSALVMRVNSA